jgi:AcrR family transcriptional regulator
MTSADKNVNKESRGPIRRRRLPEAARANILEAAEAMLISSGPQSLKLVEVARAAGVSNATVLHHFGTIDSVQAALMEHMVRQLVERVLAITAVAEDPTRSAVEAVTAMFDAFEARGAARLAAWLELTGQARRLTVVRTAVREVVAARLGRFASMPAAALEDTMLASITMALGVGLFGSTLAELLDKPPSRTREMVLSLLLSRVREAMLAV